MLPQSDLSPPRLHSWALVGVFRRLSSVCLDAGRRAHCASTGYPHGLQTRSPQLQMPDRGRIKKLRKFDILFLYLLYFPPPPSSRSFLPFVGAYPTFAPRLPVFSFRSTAEKPPFTHEFSTLNINTLYYLPIFFDPPFSMFRVPCPDTPRQASRTTGSWTLSARTIHAAHAEHSFGRSG